MTNSVDPNQSSLIWSVLFASILEFVSNVRKLFAADNFSRRHFLCIFLGALRAKEANIANNMDTDQTTSLES